MKCTLTKLIHAVQLTSLPKFCQSALRILIIKVIILKMYTLKDILDLKMIMLIIIEIIFHQLYVDLEMKFLFRKM